MQLAGQPRLQLPWAESNATCQLAPVNPGLSGWDSNMYCTDYRCSALQYLPWAVLQLLYCNDKETGKKMRGRAASGWGGALTIPLTSDRDHTKHTFLPLAFQVIPCK
ncbi:hypothetical protein PspLS_02641, partial [Pyricularia sp. CBS 133598]